MLVLGFVLIEIQMYTPSGRFEPNKAICMSMSNYHPETWNPLWSVSSILRGLLSFMVRTTAVLTIRTSKQSIDVQLVA